MRFGAQLRDAASGLRAGPRTRMRVLEELRGDLEAMYEALRAAGVSDREAKRRAAAMLVPDEQASEALAAVHRPVWVRWIERYSVAGRHRIERLLLMLVTVAAVAVAAVVLIRADLLRDISLFAIPVLGIGVAAGVHMVVKAVRIWGGGERQAKRVRTASSDLLIAAVGAAVASAFGVLYELYATASIIQANPGQQTHFVVEWLQRSVALGSVGIGISLACGLAWMLFVTWAASQERRELELLGPLLRVSRVKNVRVTDSNIRQTRTT